jgi:hypothetical protein
MSVAIGSYVKASVEGMKDAVVGHVYVVNDQLIVLQQPPSQPPLPHHPPKHTYQMISRHAVTDISKITTKSPSQFADMQMSGRKLNLDKVKARESNAVRQIEQRLKKIGVGVSEQGQAIFDALSRTLPCEWERDMIVVFGGDVKIKAPYRLEDVAGSDVGSIEHVKKVVGLSIVKISLIGCS